MNWKKKNHQKFLSSFKYNHTTVLSGTLIPKKCYSNRNSVCHAYLASITFQACSLTYMSWSFHSDKIQKSFLGQQPCQVHTNRGQLWVYHHGSSQFISSVPPVMTKNTHTPSITDLLTPFCDCQFPRPFNRLFSFPQHDTTTLLMILSCPLPKNSSQNAWHHHHPSPIMAAFTQHTLPQAAYTFGLYNPATLLSSPDIHPN
jgi:hypothetical protein